jgi:two-component sensor histidine kinase
MLRLSWTERGGPRIEGQPGSRGFGSRMLDAIIRQQLGGSLRFDWTPEGLQCEIGFPLKGQSLDPRDSRHSRT